MKIHFLTSSTKPMYNWLLDCKISKNKDLIKLKEILNNEEYGVEFSRYQLKNLPVSTISYEEAVDFFTNFLEKDFNNPRLEYKKPYFLKFYNDLENKIDLINLFTNFSKKDEELIDKLLENGLPNNLLKDKNEVFNILFIISIGNSMGWPYKNYIDFDVANLELIKDKVSFLHLIAHEIHHTKFPLLINKHMNIQESFLVNFAFEGLAMHFTNNASTLYKAKKYIDEPSYEVDEFSWNLFTNDFEELFNMFKKDFYDSGKFSNEDELNKLIENHYEKFTYYSYKNQQEYKIAQYPTYYLGCYLFGIIDNAFGKEVLFDVIKNPSKFVNIYNKAVVLIGNQKYLM